MTDGKRGSGGRKLANVIKAAVDGGVQMVVIRERERSTAKLAELIQEVIPLRRAGTKLLISRRADLALAFGLDGVHLGGDAAPIAEVRRQLGPGAWIGYSAHEGAEAKRAADDGADYVTLSPIYTTASKPGVAARGLEWLRQSCRLLDIPVLALGGVTLERVPELIRAGASGVAVVSAIGAAPDVRTAAENFNLTILEQTE